MGGNDKQPYAVLSDYGRLDAVVYNRFTVPTLLDEQPTSSLYCLTRRGLAAQSDASDVNGRNRQP